MPRSNLAGVRVRCAVTALAVFAIVCVALPFPDTTGAAHAQATMQTEKSSRSEWVDPDLVARTPSVQATDSPVQSSIPKINLPSWSFIEASPYPNRPNHVRMILQAVEQLLGEGHISSAQQLANTIDHKELSRPTISHLQLLKAKILYMAEDYQSTVRSLQTLRLSDLTPRQRATASWLRMAGLLGLQRIPEAVAASQGLQSIPTYDDIASTGYQLIWKTMESLPISKLAVLYTEEANSETVAWAELAKLIVIQTWSQDAFALELESWKLRYPSHPANLYVLEHITFAAGLSNHRHQQVALLLPLTSTFEQAAKAVRDGFLMLWRKDISKRRPKIRIYDYGDQTELVNAYYDAALRDQVDFIIGPLGTKAVQQISKRQNFAVPTLLLGNFDPDLAPRPNTYQFSLAPEDEAAAVARRAFADGHRQASILYPDTARGRNIFTSWKQAWGKLGGKITESKPYDIKVSDHTEIIRALFNLDRSTARRNSLQESLSNNVKIKFSARRRQDIDALFLFGDSDQTRLIKPQIDFHHAHELPVYGLSSIYNGKLDPVKDLDLEGIVFGDMPWLLGEGGQIESLRQIRSNNTVNIGAGMERLFALGIDSFALINIVDEMQHNPNLIYSGLTGRLSGSNTGKIWRRLEWATIKDAEPLHRRLATLPAPPRLDLKFLVTQSD